MKKGDSYLTAHALSSVSSKFIFLSDCNRSSPPLLFFLIILINYFKYDNPITFATPIRLSSLKPKKKIKLKLNQKN